MRKISFVNGEYYHVYNRGVEKIKTFHSNFDFLRFCKSMEEFNDIDPVISLYIKNRIKSVGVRPLQKKRRIVEIVSYCLIPNHFHLILKQLREGGISEFMKRLSGGYTGYFNYKNKRSGVLFQGKFKSIHIDSNDYLLYLSAYVNGNFLVHRINNRKWKYSSLNNKNEKLSNLRIFSKEFKNFKDYKKYVSLVVKGIKEKREEMKKYILE